MTKRALLAVLLLACGNERQLDLIPAIDNGASGGELPPDPDRVARMNITGTIVSANGETPTSLTVRQLAETVLFPQCIAELQALNVSPFVGAWATNCDAASDTVGAANPTCGDGWCNGTETYVSCLADCGSTRRPGPPQWTANYMYSPTRDRVKECQILLSREEQVLCVGNRLLELATAVGETSFTPSTGTTYVIPPQDAESRAGLAEEAFHYGAYAVTRAGETFRYAIGYNADGVCGTTELALSTGLVHANGSTNFTMLFGDLLANQMREGLIIASDAADTAAEYMSAVADADTARGGDHRLATRRAWNDPYLSRGRAVQIYQGGAEVTYSAQSGIVGGNPCETLALSSGARKAVGIIRSSAAMPMAVEKVSTSFDTWFTTAVEEDTALRVRLGDLWMDADLYEQQPATFLAEMGLEETDFKDAQNYLTSQRYFFDRHRAAYEPESEMRPSTRAPLPGETPPLTTTVTEYWGTAAEPEPLPVSHLVARAKHYQTTTSSCSTTAACDPLEVLIHDGVLPVAADGVVPGPTYAQRGLGPLRDYAATVASHAADLVGSTNKGRTALAEIVTSARAVQSTRTEICYRNNGGTHQARFRVYGLSGNSGLKVVKGVNGLRCAESGMVDGQACSLSTYEAVLSTDTDSSPVNPRAVGFGTYVGLVAKLSYANPIDYYLVRPRVAGATPGQYESLGGIRVLWETVSSGTTWQYCTLMANDSQVMSAIQTLAAPSVDNCSTSVENCAGLRRDEPVPLENELTSDGDGVESSWRTYLAKARAAAAMADSLGEQIIQAGLEMDTRVEAAEQELEALCGGPVSLASILTAYSAYQSTCAAASEGTTCGAGGVCRNQICVVDPLKKLEALAATGDVDALRLLDCLGIQTETGADPLVKYVALGPDPLCIVVEGDAICPPDDLDGHPCPHKAEDGVCHTGETVVTETLGLVEVPQDGSPKRTGEMDCSTLRNLRSPLSASKRKHDEAKVASLMSGEDARAIAARLGWTASPGGFSAVKLDGALVFSTGEMFGAASSSWPCTGKRYAGAEGLTESPCVFDGTRPPEMQDSLFCSYAADCSSESSRGEMNDRLGAAVVALKVLSGTPLDDVKGPYAPAANGSLVGSFFLESPSIRSESGESIWVATNARYGSGEPFSASGMCYDVVPSRAIWRSPRWPQAFLGNCNTTHPPYYGDTDVVFRSYSGEPGPNTADWMSRLWSGLDGTSRRCPSILGTLGTGHQDAVFISDVGHGWDMDSATCAGLEQGGLTTHFSNEGATANAARPEITWRAVGDALELACEMSRVDAQTLPFSDALPPMGQGSLEDLENAALYLRFLGQRILRAGEREVIVNLPRTAVNAIRTPTYQYAGTQGAAVARLVSSLLALREYQRGIGLDLQEVGWALSRLKRAIRVAEIDSELVELAELAQQVNGFAQCAGGFFGRDGGLIGGSLGCLSIGFNLLNNMQQNDLLQEKIQLQEGESWAEFEASFATHLNGVMSKGDQLERAVTEIRAALADIETGRQLGERHLADALLLGTDSAGRQYAVNSVMRRRYNTLQVRYERARRKAIQIAWMARRAIEQRLGVELASLTEDMLLVEAPSSWAEDICTASGVDYARLRDESSVGVESYSEAYIGDYVDRLEAVVDSYPSDFPFMDASDVAVVSLRDDILNLRSDCLIATPNLLVSSADLDAQAWDSQSSCDEPVENCVAVDRLPESPLADWEGAQAVSAFRVVFAPGWDGVNQHPSFRETGGTGEPSAVFQRLSLEAGVYRVSWYGRAVTDLDDSWGHDPVAFAPVDAVAVWMEANSGDVVKVGSEAAIARHFTKSSVVAAFEERTGWTRYHFFFTVPPGLDGATSHTMAVRVEANTNHVHAVDIGGLMLEDVSWLESMPSSPAEHGPIPYVATGRSGLGWGPFCEAGPQQLVSRWMRGCARLCPAGLDGCSEAEVATQCYWELPFSIDNERLESGSQLGLAGFALGNYNYRTEWVAVNLAGTGVRGCEDSTMPSTCYGSGNVAYSIGHYGPYKVRNHQGEIYEAPLFVGHIEHARALADERYITNPISSADRALLSDYMRQELRGRPLTGDYRLRLWEADGFNINNVEDVQIILGYRYWTRFE